MSQPASHHVLSEFSPPNGFHLSTDATQPMSAAEQHGYINGLVEDNVNGSISFSAMEDYDLW